mgnify:FL=1|jgi:hypothetical protein|tara:strand:- start:40 stop:330 length:291 start_codon:yes stop_codon:yes gene_type:complete
MSGKLKVGVGIAKTGYGAVRDVVNKIFKPKQKTTGTGAINSVNPNVPVTKLQKAERDLNLAKHKYKGTAKKTEMTVDKINAQTKRLNEQSKKIFGK